MHSCPILVVVKQLGLSVIVRTRGILENAEERNTGTTESNGLA